MKIIRRSKEHAYKATQHPAFIADILEKRPISSEKDFDLSLKYLLPYHSLLNIEAAAKLIAEAIIQQKDILIVGDYDVDGATSIALAVRILNDFGLKSVRYIVPHRMLDGYGLTRNIVQKILFDKPDLLITVDNGISNHEGVLLARENGIDVIITDHHLPPNQLPDANVIVNPNLENDPFESKALAGVGVIFYVMLAVRAELLTRNYFEISPPNLAKYLDLVALGTISDVVPLDVNNRRLVQQGLARIRSKETVAGMISLLNIAKKDIRTLSSSAIGFNIAPLLNAAGRIDNMTIGIECLLSDDLKVTDSIAKELVQLNQERRSIEKDIKTMADDILNSLNFKTTKIPNSICLYDDGWHQGVTGIVASRIKDEYFRPTFVFAYDDEGMIKGSGRSTTGVHLRDVLNNIATKHKNLINTFGGHAMAAGLTILREHFEDFSQFLEAEISQCITEDSFKQVIYSDGELASDAYSVQHADTIKLAFPWGQSFPEPAFDDYFEVIDYRILKDVHLKMTLKHPKHQTILEAMAFFQAKQLIDNVRQIHCVYKLDVNEWMGRRHLQLIIDYFEPIH